MKNPSRRTLITGFAIILIAMGANPVLAQNTITLSLTRNFGFGLGGLISGTFTLSASGSTDVQNLTVYFNGDEVYFADGNSLAWQFSTGDYAAGSFNITVIGIDTDGIEYTGTYTATILGSEIMNIITIGIIALVAILIIAKYGPMLAKKRKRSD